MKNYSKNTVVVTCCENEAKFKRPLSATKRAPVLTVPFLC